MYLGRMGGTGKSQVIKALSIFMEKKNEAHFVILGPTGTSAALLNVSLFDTFRVDSAGSWSSQVGVNVQSSIKQKLKT